MPTVEAPPDIVLLAHGSPDPRHARGVDALAARVRATAPHRAVHTAYLDHHAPTPTEVATRAGSGVVVPVLLTPAYHARVDVPDAVAAMNAVSGPFTAVPALGPHPFLLRAAAELLTRTGAVPGTGTAVVLYAAGSSDSRAVASVAETLRVHGVPGEWGPWRVAALDGGKALPEVLGDLRDQAERVVVVAFMVADGVLRDRMAGHCEAAGVPLVTGALGDTDAAAALVLERAASLRT